MAGTFKGVLQLRASICLVDPQKLKDSRYTSHETFIDQIALADVLVANKMDLADSDAISLFQQWASSSQPEKALIAQTVQGQLDIAWLDLDRNPQRQAEFPDAHRITRLSPENNDSPLNNNANGYQSMGYIFPAEQCFDYQLLSDLLSQLKVERIKGIVNTSQGWFIINGIDGNINYVPVTAADNSRIEVIAGQNYKQSISAALSQLTSKFIA